MNSISIRQQIMQISRPVFAYEKEAGISFTDTYPSDSMKAFVPSVTPETLGDRRFKERHGITYPYVAGAMANGITSPAVVRAMAENGMISFIGAGGLSLSRIESHILELKKDLPDKPFGFNLIHSPTDPDLEMATVQLYLKYEIRRISAAAFMRMTPALVYYRVKGLYQDGNGRVVAPNHVVAKVSRVEIARQFFSPPPEKLVNLLLEKNMISDEEARLSQKIPMARDLTAEADSGGHTDNRPALALLPTIMSLKNQFMHTFQYDEPLCVGLAGGIATPESAAAAFGMGAGYILTGSINQACKEAGVCREVKQMLCRAEQADVAMAPAADMFEIGARVQVLKRGTLFPLRAEKLYKFYKAYDDFYQIDEKSRQEVEQKILQSSFEDAWMSTKHFFEKNQKPLEIERAQKDPKHKMALVFRSYLGQSSRWAIEGDPERKMDYQIWCGPAIGAFNQWVKGSFLEDYENREVVPVAMNILFGACVFLRTSMLRLQGIEVADTAGGYTPMKMDEISTYLT